MHKRLKRGAVKLIHMLSAVMLVLLLPPQVHAEKKGMLETESIRSQLFGRMDDRKKSKSLRTVRKKILDGMFSRVTDSESIWVRIDSRSEFRKWTFKLSKKNLSLPRQEIRVWLKYVSPKQSVSFGREYNTWFKKKVAFELGKTFYNRKVRVEYDYSEKLYRLEGVVWTGDTNINLWLIRNGWSFYVLEEQPPPEHEELLAAEKEARERQVGLWKPELLEQ